MLRLATTLSLQKAPQGLQRLFEAHGPPDLGVSIPQKRGYPHRRGGLRGPRIEDLLRRPEGPHPTIFQDAYPVGDLGDLVEVMGDHHDRGSGLSQPDYDAEQVLS